MDNPLTPPNSPSHKSNLLIPILVLFVVLASLGGFVLGRYTDLGNQFLIRPYKKVIDPSTPLYSTLQGTIRGKIRRVDSKLISIESNTGATGAIEAADDLYFTDTSTNPPKPPSTNLNNIPLNKKRLYRLGTYWWKTASQDN